MIFNGIPIIVMNYHYHEIGNVQTILSRLCTPSYMELQEVIVRSLSLPLRHSARCTVRCALSSLGIPYLFMLQDFYADAASNKHNTVHPRVVEKFAVKVPFPEVITSLLMEVAQQYNIEYTPSSQPMINVLVICSISL